MKLLLSLLFVAVPVLAAPPKNPAKPANANPPAAAPAAAATTTSAAAGLDAAVKARIEAFFTNVQGRRVKEGFERLYEGSTVVADQPAILETQVKNMLLMIEQWGKMESGEILRVRNSGRFLKEVTCTLNLQKRPFQLTLYVYFGEGRWQVLDAALDPELHSFFEPEQRGGKS